MDRTTFLAVTAIAHVSLAAVVTAHAAATDRSAGRWPYLTLAFGIAGAAGYVLAGDPENSAGQSG